MDVINENVFVLGTSVVCPTLETRLLYGGFSIHYSLIANEKITNYRVSTAAYPLIGVVTKGTSVECPFFCIIGLLCV
jgi:hypothetical protein